MRRSNKGFTLVELIIVIAILAIIMLIAIPNFSGIQQRMQVRADKATAAQIGKAVRVWMTDYSTDAGLAKPSTHTPSVANSYYPIDLPTISAFSAGHTATVEPVVYTALKGFTPDYISADSAPDSLLSDTKTIVAAQCYVVALTANAANPESKVSVLIAPSSDGTSGLSGELTILNADDKLVAGYDGTVNSATGGNPIAYIEP